MHFPSSAPSPQDARVLRFLTFLQRGVGLMVALAAVFAGSLAVGLLTRNEGWGAFAAATAFGCVAWFLGSAAWYMMRGRRNAYGSIASPMAWLTVLWASLALSLVFAAMALAYPDDSTLAIAALGSSLLALAAYKARSLFRRGAGKLPVG